MIRGEFFFILFFFLIWFSFFIVFDNYRLLNFILVSSYAYVCIICTYEQNREFFPEGSTNLIRYAANRPLTNLLNEFIALSNLLRASTSDSRNSVHEHRWTWTRSKKTHRVTRRHLIITKPKAKINWRALIVTSHRTLKIKLQKFNERSPNNCILLVEEGCGYT